MAYDFNGAAETDKALDLKDAQDDHTTARWEEIRREAMTNVDDICDVVFDVREMLAEHIAKNDPQAVGAIVIAAMDAYGSRLATRMLGSPQQASKLPDELQAAAKALATLSIGRAS
jgi:hypothetical protein